MVMEEVWKDIVGYEGLYQVSNLGRVKSLNYRRTGKTKEMKPGTDKNGYRYICLMVEGKARYYKVHRLVYEAFVGPIPYGHEINHINEEKADNRVENLEIVSHKTNINHGTCSARSGEKHRQEVVQYNLQGTTLKTWSSMSQAASSLGIDVGQISACCKRKPHYNTAGGFVWKYKKEQAS